MRAAVVALLALGLGADAHALRTMKPAVTAATAAAAPATATPAAAPTKAVAKPTQADVQRLRAKLEGVTAGLQAMLAAKGSPIGESKMGPELKHFAKELADTLERTKAVKDPAVAMQQLAAAKASMAGLTSELTGRQVALMKEEEAQQESLLLGVLMTRQKEPLEAQLEVLRSADFAGLEVSKALLAKHDGKTPLFAQAAAFLDAHKGKGSGKVAMSAAEARKAAQEKVKALAASFEQRVVSMKRTNGEKARGHEKRIAHLKDAIEKASKGSKDQRALQMLLKREERDFKKWSAVQDHDIKSMEEAVEAIKSNDVQGLEKARKALSDSVKALQSKNSGFLVLAQLGTQLTQSDCPYCAAQCVDKCHQAGKSFTTCLTDCADAGKR